VSGDGVARLCDRLLDDVADMLPIAPCHDLHDVVDRQFRGNLSMGLCFHLQMSALRSDHIVDLFL
jgi:hypothetical protein